MAEASEESRMGFVADLDADADGSGARSVTEALREAKVRPSRCFTDAADGPQEMGCMLATADVAEGEAVLRMPYHSFLNAHHALQLLGTPFQDAVVASEAAAAAAAAGSAPVLPAIPPPPPSPKPPHLRSALLDESFVLCVFLIKERFAHGARCVMAPQASCQPHWAPSRFHGYVASLPGPEDLTMPEFAVMGIECPLSLQGESTLPSSILSAYGTEMRARKALRRRDKLLRRFHLWHSTYFACRTAVFEPSAFTGKNWMWANGILASRCFSYRSPPSTGFPWRWRAIVARRLQTGAANSEFSPSTGPGGADDEDETDDDDDDDEHEEQEDESDETDDDAVDPQTGLLAGIVETPEQVLARKAAARERRRGPAAITSQMAPDESGTDSEEMSSSGDDDIDDEAGEGTNVSLRRERARGFETFTLLPIADMFNHDGAASNDFSFDRKDMSFVIRCTRRVPAGREVLIRYNNMDHWRFAKYYGFVLVHSADRSAPGPYDAFPLVVTAPPAAFVDSPCSSVVAVTKHQIFADGAFARQCCVTAKGPNVKLVAALRLRAMTESEFPRYTRAFDKEPLSVRNEWHVYHALAQMIRSAIAELEMNASSIADTDLPPALRRAALPVRARDRVILLCAAERVAATLRSLSELLYYGATARDMIRGNVIQRQFSALRKLGRLPRTREEQQEVGLGMIPHLAGERLGGDANDVVAIADVIHQRVQRSRAEAVAAGHAASARYL